MDTRNQFFYQLGVYWIKFNTDRPETYGIALQLVNHIEALQPKLKIALQQWIRDWVYKTNPNHKSWTYGWAAYWKIMPTIETAELALKWIELFPEKLNSAKWIIKYLFETMRVDIIFRIKKWHLCNLDHPVAETIKEELYKAGFAY